MAEAHSDLDYANLNFSRNYRFIPKTRTKNEFKEFGLPDSVCQLASKIYNEKLSQISREKTILKLQFCSAREAFAQLGHTVDPFELGSKFGLDKSGVATASSPKIGIKPTYRKTRPHDYISGYVEKILPDNPSISNEIINKLDEFLELDEDLIEENPIKIAIAIILYHLNKSHGINVDCTKINTNNVSSATIDTTVKYFSKLSERKGMVVSFLTDWMDQKEAEPLVSSICKYLNRNRVKSSKNLRKNQKDDRSTSLNLMRKFLSTNYGYEIDPKAFHLKYGIEAS